MSEKLKYVLTLNHPGRNKCTRASLWGLIGTLSGLMRTYGGFSGQIGLKKTWLNNNYSLWGIMGTYEETYGEFLENIVA